MAAPLLKLWPEYLLSSIPATLIACLTWSVNLDFVKTQPSLNVKRNPCWLFFHTARKDIIAVTGQRSVLVVPTYMSILNWSVSDVFSLTFINFGDLWLSIAMSLKFRWISGS